MAPPTNAARKIQTPGVLIQENVSVPGFSPQYTCTWLANGASAACTVGTRLEVPSSSTKIRMKHDQAESADLTVSCSPASIFIWKRASRWPDFSARMASAAVSASDTIEPTTTASSGPTNMATTRAAPAKDTPESSAIPAAPCRRSPMLATLPWSSATRPATSTINSGITTKNGASCTS